MHLILFFDDPNLISQVILVIIGFLVVYLSRLIIVQ